MEVIVQHRQTLSDIAIQVYGSVAGVAALAEANNVSITDDLQAGTVLECPERIYDRYLQVYVRMRQIQPATAEDPEGEIRLKIFTEEYTQEFE